VTATRFRFRPRYRGIAWTSIGVGGSLAAIATGLGVVMLPLVSGAIGVGFGAAYLASPAWRLAVTIDETGLSVGSATRLRFRLAWADVVKVVASPTTHTCYVDGGAPENSLLVPGVGASAPYAIENRAALYDAIVAHVAADRVRTVDTLESAK
jgi:hypothetical protein